MLQLYNINQISMSVQWPTNTRTSKNVAAYYEIKNTSCGQRALTETLYPLPLFKANWIYIVCLTMHP